MEQGQRARDPKEEWNKKIIQKLTPAGQKHRRSHELGEAIKRAGHARNNKFEEITKEEKELLANPQSRGMTTKQREHLQGLINKQ